MRSERKTAQEDNERPTPIRLSLNSIPPWPQATRQTSTRPGTFYRINHLFRQHINTIPELHTSQLEVSQLMLRLLFPSE